MFPQIFQLQQQSDVEELEKEFLDAREKIEYFRVKMQELVLHKSRCDNRLNEITEWASADRREVCCWILKTKHIFALIFTYCLGLLNTT
ncbi:hypothetical protein DVH24_010127 [Malus domestica]|uniref:Uncharacterized protein n=1 Tax=Malus domestica TaxID=3750 RepID=A0A498JWD4_MALDO|nr:hypothetical protein DVH24_010127 [Malus domestica]